LPAHDPWNERGFAANGVESTVRKRREDVGHPRYCELKKKRERVATRPISALRAGLRRKEETLFCVFTARLKPCPDTCFAVDAMSRVTLSRGPALIGSP